MFTAPDGKIHAESMDELMQLMQYAGGRSGSYEQNPTLGLDSPVVAAASTFLPGAMGSSDFDVTGPVSYADGPAKSSAGRAASGVRNRISSATAGPMGNVRAFGQGINARLTPVANAQTAAIAKGVRGTSKLMGFAPSAAGNAGRMAMQAMRSPVGRSIVKFAPVVGGAMAVGDLVMGDESFGNKAMDATAMTIGGILGSGIPVVGTALGATAGKMVSDGTQFLFGDKKSPEERRMEEALLALRGGVI